jgi:hypothetical protein
MIPSLFAASHIVDAVFPRDADNGPAEADPAVAARMEQTRAVRPGWPMGTLFRSLRRPAQTGG